VYCMNPSVLRQAETHSKGHTEWLHMSRSKHCFSQVGLYTRSLCVTGIAMTLNSLHVTLCNGFTSYVHQKAIRLTIRTAHNPFMHKHKDKGA
jgi:hypothetical protein